jgi:protein-S-isoprenylcysteine O-methyltransferase Ste14
VASEALDRPKYVVPPPVPPVVALVLIVLLDQVAAVSFLPQTAALVAGVPLLVLGLGFWAWGAASLSRSGESPDHSKATGRLLTEGALRVSRNPIYTGGTIGLLGLALLLNTATGVAVVVVLALGAHHLVLAEERYLEAKFGDEYRDYCSRVRRWI